MKKRNALLSGFFAILAIVSSVAVVAKFYTKPVTKAPEAMEYKDAATLSEEELKELEKAEQQVLEDLEKEVEN